MSKPTTSEIDMTAQHQEDLLDEALDETFPASDPPRAFQLPGEAGAGQPVGQAVFKRLLLATDLSPRCQEMLSRSLAMALAFDASIDVIHVHQSCRDAVIEGRSSSFVRPAAAVLDTIDRALTEIAQRMIDAGVTCRTTSLEGNPAHVIVAHALKTDADLIILGSHGHAGIIEALFGDVARRITKNARCAVMVIPMPESAPEPGHGEGRSA